MGRDLMTFELQEDDTEVNPTPPETVVHNLWVNQRMLVALLKRCGHEIDADIETRWYEDGVRVRWTTPVI